MMKRSPTRAVRRSTRTVGSVLVLCAASSLLLAGRAVHQPVQADDTAVIERLEAFIEHEMRDKELPAVSIALVDDQDVVWATGFGLADPATRRPATETTVYRVGSVSKLFTDLAIMQLVERGDLDLDAPVRPVGADEGEAFRIEPRRPIAELRADALAAEPPREDGRFRAADLVQPTSLDPSIRLDIRYATTDNFMGAVFYDRPRAYLQRPAAEVLVRVHRALEARGYGLLIHDAYRPWHVTRMFYDATPDAQKIFVADPAEGSRHNRGSAVDLTLFERATGRVVPMVGGYDEFSPRAFPEYPGGTARQRWHRDLLREAMEAEGFEVYAFEWWHFDYEAWRDYPISNLTFEELEP